MAGYRDEFLKTLTPERRRLELVRDDVIDVAREDGSFISDKKVREWPMRYRQLFLKMLKEVEHSAHL